MKNTLTILIAFFCASTLYSSENIKNKIIEKLNSNKTISYTINSLTIQGNTKTDTLFINTFGTASFSKANSDSVFGYNFVINDSLIHPYFNIPLKTVYYYDRENIKISTTSPMRSSFENKNIKELDPDYVDNIMEGQVIDMLFILGNNETKNLNDTIINKEICYQFGTIKNELPYNLFVSKKSLFPVMLRVTSNTHQPFIQEYYYSNFSYSSKFILPDFTNAIKKAEANVSTPEIKENDIFPDLVLNDLQGKVVSFKESSKYKIIYLSMINCGPCQEAIPDVEEMYNYYNNTDNIDFFVFYPMDSKESLLKYVSSKKIKTKVVYNSLTDEKKRLENIKMFNITFPSLLIIDKENRIKYIETGYNGYMKERVKKKIELTIADGI